MHTLITAATTARAHQLKNKLHDQTVLLGDYQDLPELLIRSNTLIRLPDPAKDAYAHKMLTLCLDREIDILYLLRVPEQVQLIEARQLFEEFNIAIIINADNEVQ